MHKKKQPEYVETITNEALTKRFRSNFAAVLHAINLAENMINTGRPPHVTVEESASVPTIVLKEIATGRDYLEPIDIGDDEEDEDISSANGQPLFIADDEEEDDEEEEQEEAPAKASKKANGAKGKKKGSR